VRPSSIFQANGDDDEENEWQQGHANGMSK
jgi:hypothetical protein